MDIYSYINSPDVAAHCREINKTWSPFDMAVIVGRSRRLIAEKHAAWRQIVAENPDMPTPKNMHVKQYDSLHQAIASVINYEERVLSLFKTPGLNTVYTYKIKIQCEYCYSESVFTTLENAIKDIQKSYERDELESIMMIRVSADSSNRIELFIDYDGAPYCIYRIGKATEELITFESIPIDFDYDMFTDRFFVDIPMPFKRGDILTTKAWQYDRHSIFVLESSVFDNAEFYERSVHHKFGDGSDLTGWGYFIGDRGDLYGDHTEQHDCFEYYRGNLEGDKSLLHYVSLYLKDEIGLPELLAMQCRIMLQHQLDCDLRVDTHGRFIPECLQAHNRTART